MLNKEYDWIRERLQIISMIEYLDSINDGSMEAADKLNDFDLEVIVGEEKVKIQLDRYNFDAVYNMLLTLRNINTLKMKLEQEN